MQARRATITLGPSNASSSRMTSTFCSWLRGVGSMIRKWSSAIPVPRMIWSSVEPVDMERWVPVMPTVLLSTTNTLRLTFCWTADSSAYAAVRKVLSPIAATAGE